MLVQRYTSHDENPSQYKRRLMKTRNDQYSHPPPYNPEMSKRSMTSKGASDALLTGLGLGPAFEGLPSLPTAAGGVPLATLGFSVGTSGPMSSPPYFIAVDEFEAPRVVCMGSRPE